MGRPEGTPINRRQHLKVDRASVTSMPKKRRAFALAAKRLGDTVQHAKAAIIEPTKIVRAA
jgi:hypothetical protein